ncbi:ribosome-associated protein [Duganella sp. 1224]|uniref:ribosome silencing factor n=1 Tax=Duganella sp. 1224 TaxID=2587052 RepID=UPI0015C99338|nr:ribosome silencing factor [Duganella sp. 1224]NYE61631.1 ribosome-associated protein [Duganella sp. 1224]
MDIKKLQTLVVDALEDVKAQDIVLFDTTHLTSLFDRIAIASGTSNRQTKALAASVRDKVKEAGGDVYGMEGEDTGEWVLVDLGDMIVHIMQAPIRAYYRLEEIWGDKPVKLGAAKRKSTKEAEDAAPKKVSSHLAAGKKAVDASPVVEKKTPARKPAAAKATTAKKAAADKPAVAVPAGKKVKVAAPKATVAAVKALKAAPKPRAAKPKADEAPVKTVIKRIKKTEE